MRVGVVNLDKGLDVAFEGVDRSMDAPLDLLFCEQGEKSFDLADPGRPGRREVDMPVRSLGQPNPGWVWSCV
jgi:hypothetical protein